MIEQRIEREYFDWLCHLVSDARYTKRTACRMLLRHLHERQFTYSIPMDGNRAADGIDLRYRFGRSVGYNDIEIANYLDVRPCSVLEMMVALALRCEEHIMEDPDIGDRTGQWFWNMIVSLGLAGMTLTRYDANYVDKVIDRFLNRDYERDGRGGLFRVESCKRDMRTIEIWYQMHMYLESIT